MGRVPRETGKGEGGLKNVLRLGVLWVSVSVVTPYRTNGKTTNSS